MDIFSFSEGTIGWEAKDASAPHIIGGVKHGKRK